MGVESAKATLPDSQSRATEADDIRRQADALAERIQRLRESQHHPALSRALDVMWEAASWLKDYAEKHGGPTTPGESL